MGLEESIPEEFLQKHNEFTREEENQPASKKRLLPKSRDGVPLENLTDQLQMGQNEEDIGGGGIDIRNEMDGLIDNGANL